MSAIDSGRRSFRATYRRDLGEGHRGRDADLVAVQTSIRLTKVLIWLTAILMALTMLSIYFEVTRPPGPA